MICCPSAVIKCPFKRTYYFIFGKECLVFGNIICCPFRMYCLAPYTVPLGPTKGSQKSQILCMTKIILHFCTPPISSFMVCWFQNRFVLVVPSKLSWGRTLKVFVPQNGLNVLNPGPKQLWNCTELYCTKLHHTAPHKYC